MNLKVRLAQSCAFCFLISLSFYFYASSNHHHRIGPHQQESYYHEKQVFHNFIPYYNETSNSRLSVINGTKTILLWKDSWGYRFGSGRSVFINAGCRVSNCMITTNSSLLPEFDAYIIHPPTQKKPWSLSTRRSDQIFVMFSTEPPVHMPDMNQFEDYFNWTISYRRGADFQLTYGEILPLESAPSKDQDISELKQSAHSSGINPARGKTKLAIWLASNCLAKSNRQDYIKILRQYVDIDIFSKEGRCGGIDACPRDQNHGVCYDLIESTYKFYLAFENSICEDYVTEKFFEMMGRRIVPVVMGGADYSSIAPSHSYINALDYTPKELAEYLKLLNSNDTLYAEYFWWKPHYRVRNLYHTNRRVFCNLCEALHTQPIEPKTAKNLQQWLIDDSKCINNPNFHE